MDTTAVYFVCRYFDLYEMFVANTYNPSFCIDQMYVALCCKIISYGSKEQYL